MIFNTYIVKGHSSRASKTMVAKLLRTLRCQRWLLQGKKWSGITSCDSGFGAILRRVILRYTSTYTTKQGFPRAHTCRRPISTFWRTSWSFCFRASAAVTMSQMGKMLVAQGEKREILPLSIHDLRYSYLQTRSIRAIHDTMHFHM